MFEIIGTTSLQNNVCFHPKDINFYKDIPHRNCYYNKKKNQNINVIQLVPTGRKKKVIIHYFTTLLF